MKKVLAMVMVFSMLLALAEPLSVKATEPEIEDLLLTDMEAAYTLAKAKLSAGEASLVSAGAAEWTTGGPYKDGDVYVESTKYWTNNGSISMSTVSDTTYGSVVKITSQRVSNDYEGQANFKLSQNVSSGDKLFYAFRVKALSSDGNTESGSITTGLRLRPNPDKSGSGQDIQVNGINSAIGEGWKLICGVGTISTVDYSTTTKPFGALILQQGLYTEEFLIADLCVIDLSRSSGTVSGSDPGQQTPGQQQESGQQDPPTDPYIDYGNDETAQQNLAQLQSAESRVSGGYATKLSPDDWVSTPGSNKTDDVWTSVGGSMNLSVESRENASVMRIAVTGSSPAAYDAQVGIKAEGEIRRDDEIAFAFYIRNVSHATPENIRMFFRPVATDSQNTINVHGAMGSSFRVGSEWTLCYGTGFSPINGRDDINGCLVFQTALAEQTFEIKDLTIINLSRGVNSAQQTETEKMTYDEVMEAFATSNTATVVTYGDFLAQDAYEAVRQDNYTETNFTANVVTVTGQSFSKAIEIESKAVGNNAWSGQVYFNFDPAKTIVSGDTLFFTCKVRGISSVTNKEANFVTANTRIRPDGATSANFNFTADIKEDASVWTTVFGACTAPAAGTDTGTWVFQLAGAQQKLQIADLKVINFKREFSVSQMPVMAKTYSGMEPDAAWRTEANARIEAIRKQDVNVVVVDGNYNPISGANVDIDQLSHAFGFGTIVNVDSYEEWDDTTKANYKTAFELISHNRAGFENALKHYYITDTQRQALVDEWIDYFLAHGKEVRGHVLVYGDDSRFKNVALGGATSYWSDMDLVSEDSEDGRIALSNHITNHISTYVDKYKGRIYNWDVVNENIPSHLNTGAGATFFWSDRLGGYDALVDWFNLAHAADPDIKLTYNDYGLFSSSQTATQYLELCQYLVEHDAPITTLGVQGHVSVMAPTTIISTLNRLSTLGKDIEITEFTCEEDDEDLQAQFTRDFMTAVFSVENVSSITTWGFWEGCMYQPKAAMVDYDFNLRKNGEVWLDMIYNQWWTDESGSTAANGRYSTRAFKGEQRVAVTYGGAHKEINASVLDSPVTLTFMYNNGVLSLIGNDLPSMSNEPVAPTSTAEEVKPTPIPTQVPAPTKAPSSTRRTSSVKGAVAAIRNTVVEKKETVTQEKKVSKDQKSTENKTKEKTENKKEVKEEEKKTETKTEEKGKLTLDITSASLAKGAKLTLDATLTTRIKGSRKLKWSTSNSSVATVSRWGKVKAKGAGSAVITVTASDGSSASCKITVTILTLKKSSAKIKAGKTVQIEVKNTSSGGKLYYSSSDENIAAVNENGVVTGNKKGKALITVTDESGTQKTFKVKVK